MTNKQQPGDHGKLPPRAGDWHSGLKPEDPNSYGPATSRGSGETVSEFLASQGARNQDPAAVDYGSDFPAGVTIQGDESDLRVPVGEDTRPRTMEFYARETHLGDVLIAMVLAALTFIAVFTSYRGFGHSWDEALYLKPAERAAAWMMGVFNSGDDSMLQRDAIDRHWGTELTGQDPLHPEVAPIPKLLDGAGLTYLTEIGIDPMTAMRLPNAVLFALTIALLYLLGTREYGRTGGFAAAAVYVLMPRVFGHAHIAASETPLAFFTVLTVWCFLVGNRFWHFALFTGIALGLAIATKVSALMLPVPLMLWGQIYKRREYGSNVFAMAFIAPLALLAVWPWLWYDGLRRFFSYMVFYLDHQKTAVYYLNRIWGYTKGPVAPWFYPLHITAVVMPAWTLVLLAIGLLGALFSTVRRPVTILFVMMAGAWLGLAMLPGSPRYDGERLFFPAFAFMALLAGGGFAMVFGGMATWRNRRGGDINRKPVNMLALLVLSALGIYGAIQMRQTHPNELNYYNEMVGGAKGAYREGFETSYWGEAVNEDVTSYLSQLLRPGDTVKTLALNELAFENLRQWGKLPDKVDFSPDEPPFDYVIMQVRQGFMGRMERQLFRSRKPLKTFGPEGVPQVVVYAGSAMEGIWPGVLPTDAGMSSTATSIEPKLNDETVTGTALSDLLTTGPPVAKVDEVTTRSLPEGTTATVTSTTGIEVLDLASTATRTTATDERLSTVAIDLLEKPAEAQTSAPKIYEGGTLPTTNTLPATPLE